ncbi:MAG TPA: sensor histidine kinase [Xanthobacteraceae bacterium]
MRWRSLRLRLVAGGIMAILVALTVAGGGLVFLFERHVTRTVGDELAVYLKQLIAGIDVDAEGRLAVTRPPADPRFSEPLSGLYWQIAADGGELLRSRSLWDTALEPPPDSPEPGEVHQHVITGPAKARLLLAERVVRLTVEGRPVAVRVAVAADLARISAAVAGFSRDLVLALVLLGLVLALATVVQVSLGLQPLVALRRGIADVRAGRVHHLAPAVPVEVQPLVEEVNALLDAQERELERSRGRAADLAHGLKTPLAALAGDARRLRERGEDEIAGDIESVAEAMGRHVDRELARVRARGSVRRKEGLATALAPLVHSLVRTLSRTPSAARVSFEAQIPDGLSIPIDRVDLAEVLGNILENAARHAASRVRISATSPPAGPSISIEDDGEGIAPAVQAGVVQRGVRLDQHQDGAGRGLAIVQDLLDAYGWRLSLGTSDRLGGLEAVIAAAAGPARALSS